MIDYLKMTPAFQAWCFGLPDNQSSPLHYSSYHARVDQILLYLDLIWPDFTEKEGFILRKSAIPEDWDNFKQDFQGQWSTQTIEYLVNHVHMEDVFLNDPDTSAIDISVYASIADTIASAWKSRLQSLFPEKQFEVGVDHRDSSPEVYAFQIELS